MTLLLGAALTIGAIGCTAPTPTPPAADPGSGLPDPAPTAAPAAEMLLPSGEPRTVAAGLRAPWSVVRLADGTALVSERDTGRVIELRPDGTKRTAARIAGVRHGGEGGLLGLAVDSAEQWLSVYLTAERDNRIRRYPLQRTPEGIALGEPESVLTGIPRSRTHNGGRLAFGPDGMLYATTGDAGVPSRAQSRSSLAGKLLRLTPEGGVPDDNPFPGSPVYSLGHRNPQGLVWDADGTLWAAEFGQNTWDELNRIEPGGNYGWPEVEGRERDPRYRDPVVQWRTARASPSGLTWIDGTLFVAALRGRRVIAVHPGDDGAQTRSTLVGEHGRVRLVLPGPEGTLWLVTNNTDGRGTPKRGDDRILEYRLAPAAG